MSERNAVSPRSAGSTRLDGGHLTGGRTHVFSSSGRMPMPVSRRTSCPGSPPSPVAFTAEMVTLSSPEPTMTLGSVRPVSRSFSRASLAFERSSRRKMSFEP